MPNLTAAQYKAEYESAYNLYKSFSVTQLARGHAWSQIASAYALLEKHQQDFDRRGLTPSAAALVDRTRAETALKSAKATAGPTAFSSLNSAASCLHSNAAGVAAFAYVQQVRFENSED